MQAPLNLLLNGEVYSANLNIPKKSVQMRYKDLQLNLRSQHPARYTDLTRRASRLSLFTIYKQKTTFKKT